MTAPSHRDLEEKIRMAAESAEAKALRDHINYAVSAYAKYLEKHAVGFNISITVGNPTPAQGATISILHPWNFHRH